MGILCGEDDPGGQREVQVGQAGTCTAQQRVQRRRGAATHRDTCSRTEGSCSTGRAQKQSPANNRAEEPQLLPARLHFAHFKQAWNTICALTVSSPLYDIFFFPPNSILR